MYVKRLIGLRFLILSLMMCVFFPAVAAAAGITLKMPNNGAPLELGKEVHVVWTYSGLPDTATVPSLYVSYDMRRPRMVLASDVPGKVIVRNPR